MGFVREGAVVDVVEINPAVVPIAEQFFDFDPTRVRVTIDDGRHFLRTRSERYDVIVLDAVDAEPVPPVGGGKRADIGDPALAERRRQELDDDAAGMALRDDYRTKRYHQPSDEWSDDWDLRGPVETMEVAYEVGNTIANANELVRLGTRVAAGS